MSIFEHPVRTLAGEPSSLAPFQGHPFLVVNVAQAEGSQTPFPRAARLEWDQASRTV